MISKEKLQIINFLMGFVNMNKNMNDFKLLSKKEINRLHLKIISPLSKKYTNLKAFSSNKIKKYYGPFAKYILFALAETIEKIFNLE